MSVQAVEDIALFTSTPSSSESDQLLERAGGVSSQELSKAFFEVLRQNPDRVLELAEGMSLNLKGLAAEAEVSTSALVNLFENHSIPEGLAADLEQKIHAQLAAANDWATLKTIIESKDSKVRLIGVKAISHMPQPLADVDGQEGHRAAVLDTLRELVNDRSVEVQLAAIEMVSDHGLVLKALEHGNLLVKKQAIARLTKDPAGFSAQIREILLGDQFDIEQKCHLLGALRTNNPVSAPLDLNLILTLEQITRDAGPKAVRALATQFLLSRSDIRPELWTNLARSPNADVQEMFVSDTLNRSLLEKRFESIKILAVDNPHCSPQCQEGIAAALCSDSTIHEESKRPLLRAIFTRAASAAALFHADAGLSRLKSEDRGFYADFISSDPVIPIQLRAVAAHMAHRRTENRTELWAIVSRIEGVLEPGGPKVSKPDKAILLEAWSTAIHGLALDPLGNPELFTRRPAFPLSDGLEEALERGKQIVDTARQLELWKTHLSERAIAKQLEALERLAQLRVAFLERQRLKELRLS